MYRHIPVTLIALLLAVPSTTGCGDGGGHVGATQVLDSQSAGDDDTMAGMDHDAMGTATDVTMAMDGMDGMEQDSMTMPMDGMTMDGMDMDGMSMVPVVLDLPAASGPFDVAKAPDLDAAPGVVEVALDARIADVVLAAGKPATAMWTYNGQLPGPQIEARVGDTVRIRFTNHLPEATTIHWHGVRVPAAMDGVEAMQTPVPPGGEFTYEFVVPDAGTFWYHPHVRSAEQVERGLYGALVVRGANEPTTSSDHVVVLDDVLVDDGFQLAAFSPDQGMVGRQGNVILANGRAHPIVPVAPGGLHRFRFVNASNARYFKLELPGATIVQIGTDGGLLEAPRSHDALLLVPGERADVVVSTSMSASGRATWLTLPYDRGHGTAATGDAAIFDMEFTGGMVHPTPAVPAHLGSVAELPAATVTRMLMLGESDAGAMGGMPGASGAADGGPVFSINGKVYPDGEAFTGRLGDVEAWTIHNMTPMDHPFHLHGFRFQIEGDRAWRDTINVPMMSGVTFRVRLEDHPGTWMFHCHILEHAERGMMGHLMVE